MISAAYEGGHRLERREENMLAAFTYGKKLRYSEIDDPSYIPRLIATVTKKSKKSNTQRSRTHSEEMFMELRHPSHATKADIMKLQSVQPQKLEALDEVAENKEIESDRSNTSVIS